MMRKRNWKSARPSSLSEAMELCIEFAAERRRPIKVLADLMGVETKTLYRWLAETSMPLNRIRQFESFCGIDLVSEYLCLAQGSRVVIDIPTGKKANVAEVSEVQANAAAAMALLPELGALRERYRDAERYLEKVASGKVSLGRDNQGEEVATEDTVVMESGGRVFGRSNAW